MGKWAGGKVKNWNFKLRCRKAGHSAGFTLIELLVTVCITAFIALITSPLVFDEANKTCFESSTESMGEIVNALLGTTSDRVRGNVRFAGYVQDMGGLPDLIDESGQPRGLWTNDPQGTPENEDDDLVGFRTSFYESHENFRMGWRGPYLKPPADDALKDRWGNPFVFSIDKQGNFEIRSLGADNQEGGEEGTYDQDIVFVVRKCDYTGRVAGYVAPLGVNLADSENNPVKVRIYCQAPRDDTGSIPRYEIPHDSAEYLETTAESDGYFLIEDVPIGTQRLLLVTQNSYKLGYKIAVEPGTTWLGHRPGF